MKRAKRRVAHLLLALIAPCALGCPPAPKPQPVPPPAADCAAACARAAELGCTWAEPTPNGASCAEVCQDAQDFGDGWDLGCRSAALSCVAADACDGP